MELSGGSRKRRRTQEERSAETSGRLLAATIDLLLEKGYSRFRIADAAARAKVSRGAQTHHFATKQDLIGAAIDKLFSSEIHVAQAEATASADSEIIRQAALHAGKFLASKLYRVSANLLISAGEHEHLADGVRAISARSREPIEEPWVSRIASTGVDHDEARVILSLLWSVQRGLAIERAIGGDLGSETAGDQDLAFTIDLLDEHLAAMNATA